MRNVEAVFFQQAISFHDLSKPSITKSKYGSAAMLTHHQESKTGFAMA